MLELGLCAPSHLSYPILYFNQLLIPSMRKASHIFQQPPITKGFEQKKFHSLILLLGSLLSSTKKPNTEVHRVCGDPTGKKTNIGKGITRLPKWLSTSILEGWVRGMEFLHAWGLTLTSTNPSVVYWFMSALISFFFLLQKKKCTSEMLKTTRLVSYIIKAKHFMEIKRLESKSFYSSLCKALSFNQFKKWSSSYVVNSWGEMIHNPHAQRGWLASSCFYSTESVSIYVCLTRCKSNNGNLLKACALSMYNTRNNSHNSFQRYKTIYKTIKT